MNELGVSEIGKVAESLLAFSDDEGLHALAISSSTWVMERSGLIVIQDSNLMGFWKRVSKSRSRNVLNDDARYEA